MYYLTFLRLLGQFPEDWAEAKVNEEMRGYDTKSHLDPEFGPLRLSVGDLCFDVCPTNRNIFVTRVQGHRAPPNEERARGKAIERLYFKTHESMKLCMTTAKSDGTLDSMDPWVYLTERAQDLVSDALKFAEDKCDREDWLLVDQAKLQRDLSIILSFESHIVTTILQQRLSHLPQHTLDAYFEICMAFSLEPVLDGDPLGFSGPVRPDFVLDGLYLGDIKTGKWKDYMNLTLAAYALAYEFTNQQPINIGAIHNVRFKTNCPVPLHYDTKFRFIGNSLRSLFIQKRDSKLEVIRNEKDPGKPNKAICKENECPFLRTCWG